MGEDEEIDKIMKDGLDKDITQEDKVDESVEEHLGQMAWLWSTVIEKMKKDAICFECKKEINVEKEPPLVFEATKVSPGVVAFVSICNKCSEQIEKEQQKKEKEKKKNV